MNDLAHELWSAAQLVPGEGIEDGAQRIAVILERIDDERGKDAVAWVDTLDAARPRCITNLDYRSLIEAELGVEYVPLFLTPTSTIPEGMCLVPINPTAEMKLAGREADEAWGESTVPPVEFEEGLAVIYRAMLAAAQGERK